MRILAETLDNSLTKKCQRDSIPTPAISIKSVKYRKVLLKTNKLNLIAEDNASDKLNTDSKLSPLKNAAAQTKDKSIAEKLRWIEYEI